MIAGRVIGGQQRRRDDPGELELDPIGVLAVDRTRRAVVGRADEGAGGREALRQPLEVRERVDLPREVVQADRTAAGRRRGSGIADREQSEVVVVGRALGPEEHGAGKPDVGESPEPEHVLVERRGPVGVADVEHGVVETVDRHRWPPASRGRLQLASETSDDRGLFRYCQPPSWTSS